MSLILSVNYFYIFYISRLQLPHLECTNVCPFVCCHCLKPRSYKYLTAHFDDGLRWRSVSYADILFIYTESV